MYYVFQLCEYCCHIYSTWKAHASYDTLTSSVPSLALPYFSTLPQKWHYFLKKKIIEHEVYVLILWKIFNLRRIQQDTQDFVWSTRCSSQILIKIELFGQTSKNLQISNLNENPSSGSRVVPCRQRDKRQTDGQTETHDEANRRFSQFCERA